MIHQKSTLYEVKSNTATSVDFKYNTRSWTVRLHISPSHGMCPRQIIEITIFRVSWIFAWGNYDDSMICLRRWQGFDFIYPSCDIYDFSNRQAGRQLATFKPVFQKFSQKSRPLQSNCGNAVPLWTRPCLVACLSNKKSEPPCRPQCRAEDTNRRRPITDHTAGDWSSCLVVVRAATRDVGFFLTDQRVDFR